MYSIIVFFSRLCLDVSTGPIIHGFSTKILYTLFPIIVLGRWIFTDNTELLRWKPLSFLICPQHISQGLSWHGIWASVLSGCIWSNRNFCIHFSVQVTCFSTAIPLSDLNYQHTRERRSISMYKCVCVCVCVCVCEREREREVLHCWRCFNVLRSFRWVHPFIQQCM